MKAPRITANGLRAVGFRPSFCFPPPHMPHSPSRREPYGPADQGRQYRYMAFPFEFLEFHVQAAAGEGGQAFRQLPRIGIDAAWMALLQFSCRQQQIDIQRFPFQAEDELPLRFAQRPFVPMNGRASRDIRPEGGRPGEKHMQRKKSP